MPIVSCQHCAKEFTAKPSWLKRGEGKYCSSVCAHGVRKSGAVVACYRCGIEVYKQQKSLLKAVRHFCSRECSTLWHNSTYVGALHKNFKRGEYAYREALARTGLEKKCALCGMEEKAVIIVHHLDKNRKHNEPHNLTWLCRNCHYLVHHYESEHMRLMNKLA